MSWENILKKEEDREGLEIELEQLIDRWGDDKHMGDVVLDMLFLDVPCIAKQKFCLEIFAYHNYDDLLFFV